MPARRQAQGGEAQPGNPGLRAFFNTHIQNTLDGMAAPSWKWLGLLLALHAVLLAVGLWLLR